MLEHILDGGPIMIPLLLLSILALAVIIDRMRAFRAADVDTSSLKNKVMELLSHGKVDEAIAACEKFGGPVAAVLLVGLTKLRKLVQRGKTNAEIESGVSVSMQDYAPHVVEALEKRLNYLTLIGATAPLLGMTGTVTGMIASFESMAGAGGLDASAVSGGIAEALVTTAAGLIVAIPSVVFYNIFSKRVEKFTLDIEENSTELIENIALDLNITA